MQSITPLVLVFVLAVSVQGWENLPSIPAGRRAEYYLLQNDGAYKYGYDTGKGQSAVVNADPANQVQGQYSYVDNMGQKVSLAYTAGDEGFVPQLEGLRTGTTGLSSSASNVARIKKPLPNNGANSETDPDYDANADASYSFNIDTDNYKRTETSDSKGNVRGQYSYTGEGGDQRISYIAGEGTGFVGSNPVAGAATSSAISPQLSQYSGEPSNSIGNTNNDGSYSFSYSTNDQSREETADSRNNVRGSYSFKAKDDGQTRRVDYEAGSATGFVTKGAHLSAALPISLSPGSEVVYSSTGQGDISSYSASSASGVALGDSRAEGSYSFSYDAGDHSRQESADSLNNVRGSFSFKGKDDGQIRRVDYEAGAATGFVAKGSHLPDSTNPTSSVKSFKLLDSQIPVSNSPGIYSGGLSSPSSVISSRANYSQASVSNQYSDSRGKKVPSGDASYYFSYNTGDQSRKESSDVLGNVNGQFSFVATDGIQRRVDYTAGAEKGFVAKGAHLPVVPQTLAAGQSSPDQSSSFNSPFGQSVQKSTNGYSGNSNPIGSSLSGYSFAYNAGDHSRQESGDAQNNVRGSFSFKAKDDGQTRQVNYEAGAATGFIAKGSHLPIGPSLSGPSNGYSSSPSQTSTSAHSFSSGFLSSPEGFSSTNQLFYAPAITKSSGPNTDGSYAFSYNAGDHAREEVGDSRGNVRGKFSFTTKDDGQTRQVAYEAGSEKGFIASGAHLPSVVTLPSSSASSSGSVGYQVQAPYQGGFPDSSQDSGDASYSYSYQTDSSSKQESSDALGNVMGSFTFLGGDGVSRSVQYTSRGDEGFIASGEHIPKTSSPSSGYSASNVLSLQSNYAASARSSHAKSHDVSSTSFRLHKFLPPESSHKFGYIFDTKN